MWLWIKEINENFGKAYRKNQTLQNLNYWIKLIILFLQNILIFIFIIEYFV